MAQTAYELLDVKKTSSIDDTSQLDIIVTVKRIADGGVITTRITRDMALYADLMDTITKFQQGTVTMGAFAELAIQAAIAETSENIIDTFKQSKVLSKHLELRNGHLYVDGNLINNTLEKHVLSIMREHDNGNETEENWLSLVNFVEKLYKNQSNFVRNQFYGWLDYQVNHGKITLTTDGNLIAYKGVEQYTDENGNRRVRSIHAGHGFVNGKEYKNAHLPNDKGDIVEIPREEVNDNPDEGCHVGLHVGTWDYADAFGDGNTLTVEVDPADVVSVPNDSNFQKIRVSRYKVIDTVLKPLDEAVFRKPERPVNTFVPEMFSYIEYANGENTMTFKREQINLDYDSETAETISLYDLNSDHYYKLDKYNVTFYGYNNQVIRPNYYRADVDWDDFDDFYVPDDYSVLAYVSESGHNYEFDKDDIDIIDEDFRNITIYDNVNDRYMTMHKKNISFLTDDELDENAPWMKDDIDSSDNYDDKVKSSADEPAHKLTIPDDYTQILYVSAKGVPSRFYETDVEELTDQGNNHYLVKTFNGEYRSLDFRRTVFLEENDLLLAAPDTDPHRIQIMLGNIDEQFNVSLDDVAFIVQDKTELTVSLIMKNGDIVEL